MLEKNFLKRNGNRYSNEEGKNVCMIGDGINDALVLSTAYTGIAMGRFGSDIAIKSADAVFVVFNSVLLLINQK